MLEKPQDFKIGLAVYSATGNVMVLETESLESTKENLDNMVKQGGLNPETMELDLDKISSLMEKGLDDNQV